MFIDQLQEILTGHELDGSRVLRGELRGELGELLALQRAARREIAWVATAKVPFMAPAADDSLVRAELLRVIEDGTHLW